MTRIKQQLTGFFQAFYLLLRDALKEAFPAHPFRIVGRRVDESKMQIVYHIKVKRIPRPITLSAHEILEDDKYFYGLSKQDRNQIREQYLADAVQPKAFIEAYPLDTEPHNGGIFKIFCVDEKKIVCRTALQLIQDDKMLTMLSKKDIVALSLAYYQEKFAPQTDRNLPKIQRKVDNKIIFLK